MRYNLSPQVVLLCVCREYGVKVSQVLSKYQHDPLMSCRRMVAWVMFNELKMPQRVIGTHVNRTSASVYGLVKYFENNYREQLHTHTKLNRVLKSLRATINTSR